MQTATESTTKTLIVVEKFHDEERRRFITYAENFQFVDATETYSDYGQKNSELGEGWNVKAFTFWNGNNWQSFVMNEDEFGSHCVVRIDEGEEREILAAYAKCEFPSEYDRGVRRCEIEGYEFSQSLFASDPWVSTIH